MISFENSPSSHWEVSLKLFRSHDSAIRRIFKNFGILYCSSITLFQLYFGSNGFIFETAAPE
jgi:hypothetical protein